MDNDGWTQPQSDMAHMHQLAAQAADEGLEDDGVGMGDPAEEFTEELEAVLNIMTGDENEPPEGFDEPQDNPWDNDPVTELETLRNNLEQSKQREEDLLKIHNKAVEYLDDDRRKFWAHIVCAMIQRGSMNVLEKADKYLEEYDDRFNPPAPEPGKEGERKLDL